MTAQVIPFQYHATSVRAITDESGEPWFVAADVCSALCLKTEQIRRLDDDEKGLRNVQTLGGQQEMSVINESGLYHLIMTSRKPEAKKFRKWVTAEVLPSIRKTGVYVAPSAITPAQQRHLHDVVNARAATLPKEKQHLVYKQLWNKHNKHFDIAKYSQLPVDRYEESIRFLETAAIEGEYLPAAGDKMTAEQSAAILTVIKAKISHLGDSAKLDSGFDIYGEIKREFGSAYTELDSSKFHDVLSFVSSIRFNEPGAVAVPAQRILTLIEGGQITQMKPIPEKACIVDLDSDVSIRTFFGEYLPLEKLSSLIRMATDRLEIAAKIGLPKPKK